MGQVRVVHDYTDTPVDHLVWGFALFGSEGSLDLQGCGGVRLRDVLDLLLCLVLKHLGKTVSGSRPASRTLRLSERSGVSGGLLG